MRSKINTAICIAASSIIITSCANEKAAPVLDLEKAKTEIQAMEDAFAAAEKVKDADKVGSYYSDDAVSYGRNRQPEVGKAAIVASIKKRLAEDTTGNTNVYKVVDLIGEGNTLVEIGSWTEINASGAEVNKGHYMSLFQKKDDKWVCIRDMNVTSSPVK